MTHGHEVLHIMAGNSYKTREELVEDMTASQLGDFLEARGKFKPAGVDDFTVDITKVCNH